MILPRTSIGRCLAYHLMGAGEWHDTVKLFTDLGYIEMCVDTGRVLGVIEDIAEALSKAMMPSTAAGDEMGLSRLTLEEEVDLMQV